MQGDETMGKTTNAGENSAPNDKHQPQEIPL